MTYDVSSIYELLGKSAVIHIYSFPNFVLETFLCLIVCLMYLALHYEINFANNSKINIVSNLAESYSQDSLSTMFTQYRYRNSHRKKGSADWSLNANRMMGDYAGAIKTIPEERMRYIDNLITLTPTEFVQVDKERRLRDRELSGCLKSLTSLCESVIMKKESRDTIRKQIEMAKQHAEYVKNSTKNMHLDTAYMTKSFFDLMEQLVTRSNLDNPVPFKGDFTGLALDAGKLDPLGSDSVGALRRTSTDTSIKSEDLVTDELPQDTIDDEDFSTAVKKLPLSEEYGDYIINHEN
ncbi:uncharacterized protein LOC108735510 isoform X2 [Agrilus planipennis]|uniref:Uncharacterized protein LOC108735510 isoform X2 n=1 Tax=Agrilus planipennis TaxID=224129 RepID=A0A1W4WS81_AGRPL|nr:uncharacterized protein LOC108735510 isoform X2 [Agrilus planipennis]